MYGVRRAFSLREARLIDVYGSPYVHGCAGQNREDGRGERRSEEGRSEVRYAVVERRWREKVGREGGERRCQVSSILLHSSVRMFRYIQNII
jgi:hypothetical protein